MKKIFICETRRELAVDIDRLVRDYEKRVADGPWLSVDEYVRDYLWAGQDDDVYYCDNSDEIQAEICALMLQIMRDGNK